MKKVGITGGIGSGKSLVCKIFEILGVPVFYADVVARKLMENDFELRQKITTLLSERAFEGDKLNRAYIASRVFENADQLEQLNRIVHPAVRKAFFSWSEGHSDEAYVIEEAAILFESGASGLMDATVLIYAPETIRIRRVMERDHIDEPTVRKRIRNQMDEEEKRRLADYTIFNDEADLLIPQVIGLHNKLLNNFK